VFAALGLLAGLAWRRRLTLRERRWYVLAPLIAGVCLLTLLGAGAAHVDVLGHALGFVFGVAAGWLYARAEIPRDRTAPVQIAAGIAAVSLICAAWLLALSHAP
jgi:membrane associated rhomboid family serine protease